MFSCAGIFGVPSIRNPYNKPSKAAGCYPRIFEECQILTLTCHQGLNPLVDARFDGSNHVRQRYLAYDDAKLCRDPKPSMI